METKKHPEQLQKRHILIVDDDIAILKTAEVLLQKKGYIVTTLEDSSALMAVAKKHRFDLILLDLVMDKVDGYQALKNLKSDAGTKTVPVLVMSGLKDKNSVANSIKLGAAGYLGKPFDPAGLIGHVEQLLATHPPAPAPAPKVEAAKTEDANKRKDILKEIVTKLENNEMEFPSMPEVGFKIVNLLQDDSVPINKVSEFVEKEPGIAAKIIMAANSSLYAGAKPAMNARDAIVRIGVKQAMNYVLLATNSNLYKTESPLFKELREKLWKHSLVTATASRISGATAGYGSVENLFSFGLLHDIGKILLLRVFGVLHKTAPDQTQAQIEESLEKLHSAFGAQMLEKWKFPKEFVQVTKQHHDKPIKGKVSDAAIIVGFSNLLAHELEQEFTDDKLLVFSRVPHTQVLKFRPQVVKKVADQVSKEVEVLEKLFS